MTETPKPERDRQIAVPLESLNLARIEWVPRRPFSHYRSSWEGSQRVEIGNVVCRVDGIKNEAADERVFQEPTTLIKFRLLGLAEEELLRADIVYSFSPVGQRWDVATSIEKMSDVAYAKGAGSMFYDRMLSFIEEEAVRGDGHPVKHEVQSYPLRSRYLPALTGPRWDEIFSPILRRHRYIERKSGYWYKEFPAQK